MLVEYNGQTATSTCTATIVAPTLILTNHHCVPGRHKILKASILINYEEEDDPDAIRLEVETEPAATSGEMDFSFVRIKEPLPDGVQPLPFTPEEVSPGSRLIMIHHPAGRPKMMTQFDCRAHNKQSGQAFELRHVCDTLPGSSGGLLVNSALRPVGLHHTGGLRENDPESYNTATRMTAIREALESLTQPTGSATATPAVSSVTAPVAATPSSTTASQRTASTPPARAQTAPQNAIGGIGGQSADEAARATANSINDILN
nr:serine protease [Acuticoccus mangrovi]